MINEIRINGSVIIHRRSNQETEKFAALYPQLSFFSFSCWVAAGHSQMENGDAESRRNGVSPDRMGMAELPAPGD